MKLEKNSNIEIVYKSENVVVIRLSELVKHWNKMRSMFKAFSTTSRSYNDSAVISCYRNRIDIPYISPNDYDAYNARAELNERDMNIIIKTYLDIKEDMTMGCKVNKKLKRIEKYVNSSLESLKLSYNNEDYKEDKDEIWGQILAYETIQMLLELDELEEDNKDV